MESRDTTFASRAGERHNRGEILCALHRTKTTGNFLLYFKHAEVTLCLIIVEGNAEIREEEQIFFFVEDEPVNKSTRLSPFWPTFFRRVMLGDGVQL